jgi:hypothetical protein
MPKHRPSLPFVLPLAAVLSAAVLAVPPAARGGNAATAGTLTEELPTLRCLGVRWLIGGDDNHNARVLVEFRKLGDTKWRKGMDLFRVDSEGMRPAARPPAGQTLLAGSIFDLTEGTAYEVKLSLKDPDGGSAEKTLKMTTWSEPKLPTGGRQVDVKPGELKQALAAARPGDTLLLHKGVYEGKFHMPSGQEGKPIALVAAGDGEVILDGQKADNVIDGAGAQHVMLEGLSLRNATWAISFNKGGYATVRRCKITDCVYGLVAQASSPQQRRILIADNLFVGPSAWPRSKGIEDARGIQISGMGNVVCYNRIRGYGDGVDTFSTYPCSAIDFHNNDISECTDDGSEMDYSEHNTRNFENRYTNCYQGVSVQPIHGGPVYVFRNVLYNLGLETFKMHNGPSGGLFFHNTSVKSGMPLVLYSHEPVTNFVMRNNIFLGTESNYGYENSAPMVRCDFDYDGFGGQWKAFLKWNDKRYITMEDARKDAPVYKHAVKLEAQGLFASGVMPPADVKEQFDPKVNDLRLKPGSPAIDAGEPISNINDGFTGKAPDLGAYELGKPIPHYGPRETGK